RSSGRRLRTLNREMLARANPGIMAGIEDMHNRRSASVAPGVGGGSVSDAALAWPKLRDPFRTFKEKAWFWIDEDWDEALRRLREWARLVYCTHPLIPSLVDIYSKFPLLDIWVRQQDR